MINKNHIYKSLEINKLNSLINDNEASIVNLCEMEYNHHLNKIIDIILTNKNNYKILLLAGPSASAKTTTALKIKQMLKLNGVNAWEFSLDNFFKKSDEIPIDQNGELDYESLNSLDLKLIYKCINELVLYSSTELPIFDFIANERSRSTQTIKLRENDIVIIEGLHAINPELILPSYSSRCLKIYISVSTFFKNHTDTIFEPKEIRLIRRIIRDYKFRNTPISKTISMWPSVCKGEQLYIDPFKESAEIFIDSCLNYEPCVFNESFEKIIKIIDSNDNCYNQVYNLYKKLSIFKKLKQIAPPKDSILREFIG